MRFLFIFRQFLPLNGLFVQQGQDDVFVETNYCVPFSKDTQMEPYFVFFCSLANPTFQALGRSCDFPIETAGGEISGCFRKKNRRLQLVCREHVGRNELYIYIFLFDIMHTI